MGIVLPVVLILLFGYGLSLDVTEVPVAVVLEDPSPAATELAASFQLSHYFDARLMTSMTHAQELMLSRKVDGIVRIRPDFSRSLSLGNAEVQVLVHGVDANHARIIQAMPRARSGSGRRAARLRALTITSGPVRVQSRMWFNEVNESRYFLVPGLIVLIMTLIGALLTALVMAREWERGTLEALFVTPVRTDEILLGKTIPYFVLGVIGLVLCLLAAKFLFSVPFRGSLAMLDRGFDAVLARRPRHRPVDFLGGKKPVRGEPNHCVGHFFAGGDVIRFSLRSAQHAGAGAVDDLCAAGALLRRAAANDFSRGRYLGGDFAEHGRARRHGRRVSAVDVPGDAEDVGLRQQYARSFFSHFGADPQRIAGRSSRTRAAATAC